MYRFNADMETTAALNADVVITITQALKDEMVSRGVPAEKIEILPNGVVSERFKPLERNEKLAKELNIENKTVLGFIGSFVQYEGLEYIVDAVEILVKEGKTEIVALMVGDGAVWQDIKDRVTQKGLDEYFIFTGRIPHEEVEEYYSLVDIAPLPRKGLPVCEMVSPLKPFEAMAMEKVVLSSDVAALAEIVQDGYNGMLFEKDNIEDLAKKIDILMQDKDLRIKLGKQAREWVVKERDWKVLSQRLVNIYDKLKG
jgi:glycosyltransferase involved in cell wall biosynthesis